MTDKISKFLFKQAIICTSLATLLNFSIISLQSFPQVEDVWKFLITNFSYFDLLLYSFLPFVLFTIHKLLFQRYIYQKTLAELPHPPPQMSTRIKQSGEVLPPFPNGWFMLCESNELKKGQVIRKQALGKEFAVFRGEDGNVSVLSAFCPHLGANLAVCGKVKKNCLVCPFHGWEFNSDGKVRFFPFNHFIYFVYFLLNLLRKLLYIFHFDIFSLGLFFNLLN